MAPIWKPQPMEILKTWIETIKDEASDELSDWEEQFISNMEYRVNRGQPLTESQEKKLEEIYAQKTK